MKRVLMLLLCAIMTVGISTEIFAGELNKNEKYIIEELSGDKFTVKLEQRYINQLRNYFYQEDVSIEKADADDFIINLKEALVLQNDIKNHGATFDKGSKVYIAFEKAGTAIGLLIEYDSSVNAFYGIDQSGYIVIDSGNIIKNTDKKNDSNEDDKGWNISIEVIFAIAVCLCILGIVANLKRWNRKYKIKKKSESYEESDDDELEVANRKTRRARLQTFSYRNVKQILKYFYIPIIMALIIIGIGFALTEINKDLRDSISTNFINTQPLYNQDDEGYVPVKIEEKNQTKSISADKVLWPKYGEQYGTIQCDRLKVSAPVFWGDRGNLLDKGAGSYIGGSIPGAGDTVLIGAHDTTYFKGLEKVKKGDVFVFTTEYGIYRYKVSKTAIFDKGKYDEAYNLQQNKEQLVLYTCYPFGVLNGDKSQRMFVYLDKKSGPDIG